MLSGEASVTPKAGTGPVEAVGGGRVSFERISRNRSLRRLRDMTLMPEVPSARSASLTSAQLATVQRVWHIAGLPPVSGYGAAVLAIAVASDRTLPEMLASVDFDNEASLADSVEALLQWCQRTFRWPR